MGANGQAIKIVDLWEKLIKQRARLDHSGITITFVNVERSSGLGWIIVAANTDECASADGLTVSEVNNDGPSPIFATSGEAVNDPYIISLPLTPINTVGSQ